MAKKKVEMIKGNKVKITPPCTRRKGKSNKNNKKPMLLPHLPEEIIFEITSRLPLGYRLKFRCVCKSWSIRFNKPKQLVLTGDNEVYTLDNDTLTSPLLDGIQVRGNKLESSLASTALLNAKSSFVGSCNGIICISPPNNFCCLWNPITTEYKLLPSPPSEIFCYSYMNLYGFGYDSKNDDFKLVLVSTSDTNFEPSKGIIYSLRSKAWNQIQPIPYKFCFIRSQSYGVFCNGALHWFADSGLDLYTSPSELFALDMTDEITREIPKPNVNLCNYAYRRIGVLDGCLCMLLSNSTCFEVWVMKDYGNEDSWTETYLISKLKLPKKLTGIQYLTRIECLKTGELLLEVKLGFPEALVLYNPKNDTAKVLKFKKNHRAKVFKSRRNVSPSRSKSLFQTYEKSLVSLNSGTYFGDNVPVPQDIYEILYEDEILDEDEIFAI